MVDEPNHLLRHIIRQEMEALLKGEEASPEFTKLFRQLIRQETHNQWERQPMTKPSSSIAPFLDEERHPTSLGAVLKALGADDVEIQRALEIVENGFPGLDAVGDRPSKKSDNPASPARIKRYFEEADTKGKYLKALMYDRGLQFEEFNHAVAEELGADPVSRQTVNNWFERYTQKPEVQNAFVKVLRMSSDEQQHMDSLPDKAPRKSRDESAERTR